MFAKIIQFEFFQFNEIDYFQIERFSLVFDVNSINQSISFTLKY